MCASLSGTSLLCFNEVLSPLFSYHADLKKTPTKMYLFISILFSHLFRPISICKIYYVALVLKSLDNHALYHIMATRWI